MEVTVRPAPGDGADLARGWLDGCHYYAAQDPQRFQVPDDEGLVEWVEEAAGLASAQGHGLAAGRGGRSGRRQRERTAARAG
jgi:hypothetical protein